MAWDKLVQHVGANMSQDICNELQNCTKVTIPKPKHATEVLAKHAAREMMVRAGQQRLQTARRAQETLLEAAVKLGRDVEAPMKLAVLQNEIAQGEYEISQKVPIKMAD